MASQISMDFEKSDLLRYGGHGQCSTYHMYVLRLTDATMPLYIELLSLATRESVLTVNKCNYEKFCFS